MSDTAYSYKHEHFCQDDVVRAFVSLSAFAGEWVQMGNAVGLRSADTELDSIATMFDVDRHDPYKAVLHNFPVQLEATPDPATFCSVCLRWFS